MKFNIHLLVENIEIMIVKEALQDVLKGPNLDPGFGILIATDEFEVDFKEFINRGMENLLESNYSIKDSVEIMKRFLKSKEIESIIEQNGESWKPIGYYDEQ